MSNERRSNLIKWPTEEKAADENLFWYINISEASIDLTVLKKLFSNDTVFGWYSDSAERKLYNVMACEAKAVAQVMKAANAIL